MALLNSKNSKLIFSKKERLSNEYVYKKIQPQQYDEACQLCTKVFDDKLAPQNTPQGRESFRKFVFSNELRTAFNLGEVYLYGCFDNERLVGVIAVKKSKLNLHISLLFILPEYTKKGIGETLVRTALNRDYTKVTVNASLGAEGFYKKLGFHRTEEPVLKDGLNFVRMKKEKPNKVAIFTLSALLPVAIALLAIFGTGIFPFGDKSFLIYDLKSQYIDFYNSFSGIFSGNLFYSLSRTLGGDNFTLNAYYLFSPFNFLLLPFRAEQMVDAVLFLYLLKIGTAGLTFAICMQHTRLSDRRSSIFYLAIPIFSTAYALCTFGVSYSMNVFWLDALVLLPLVSLCIERAILGKYGAYIAVIAMSLIINFYFGFLIFIFAMTAYLAYSKIYRCGRKILSFRLFFRYSLIGVMCSAVVTVPVFFGLFVTKLSPSNPLYLIFGRVGQSEALDTFGLLFIVGSLVIASLTAVTVFVNPTTKQKKHKKSISFPIKSDWGKEIFYFSSTLLLLCASAAYMALVEGNTTKSNMDSTPYLIVAIMFVLVLSSLASGRVSKKKGLWLCVLVIFWALPNYIEPLYLFLHMGQHPLSYPSRFTFIFSFVILQSTLVFVPNFYKVGVRKMGRKAVRVVAILVVFAVGVGLFKNTLASFKNNEQEYYGYVKRDDYIEFVQKNITAVEAVKSIDDGFWRLEKTYNRSLNDAYTLGTSGISHYSSMYENEIINTLNLMGFSASAYWVQYRGATPVTDMLFGVKYILDRGDSVGFYQPELYEKIDSEGDIDIYQNEYALPIAFVGDKKFKELVADTADPFELQNKYVSALAGAEYAPFVTQSNFELTKTIYYTENENRFKSLEYEITIDTDGVLFMCLKSYKPIVSKVYVNDTYVSDYFTYDISGSMYLGTFKKGETVKVSVISDEGLFYEFERFAVLEETKIEAAYEKLSKTVLETKVNSGRIEATVNGSSTLFVSLPYSDGWSAKVDGENADTFNGGSGFLCIDLQDKGTHSVILEYTPPGIWLGVVISILGIVCILIVVLSKKLTKRGEQSK